MAEKILPSVFLCRRKARDLNGTHKNSGMDFFRLGGFDLTIGVVYIIHIFRPPVKLRVWNWNIMLWIQRSHECFQAEHRSVCANLPGCTAWSVSWLSSLSNSKGIEDVEIKGFVYKRRKCWDKCDISSQAVLLEDTYFQTGLVHIKVACMIYLQAVINSPSWKSIKSK